MDKVDVSIIIVNYNVKDYILTAIQSIKAFTKECCYEIIVVDNNSTDDSLPAIKARFPEVSIIANNYNAGFSEANNQGIRIAKGEFVFMLNPDTELISNSIDQLISLARKQPQNRLFGPRLLNTDRSIQSSVWKTPGIGSLIKETFFLNYLFKAKNLSEHIQQDKKVECVSGAAMLFNIGNIEPVGLLDPNLFWMDDTDYCFRFQKAGGKIIYTPFAEIVHHVGKSSSKNISLVISNQILSKIKFFRKHKNSFVFIISIFFSFLFIVNRLVLFGCLSFFSLFRKKEKAYYYSLIKLLKYIFAADHSIA